MVFPIPRSQNDTRQRIQYRGFQMTNSKLATVIRCGNRKCGYKVTPIMGLFNIRKDGSHEGCPKMQEYATEKPKTKHSIGLPLKTEECIVDLDPNFFHLFCFFVLRCSGCHCLSFSITTHNAQDQWWIWDSMGYCSSSTI